MMRVLLFATLFVIACASPAIAGEAIVKDGDTMVVDGVDVRLDGVDAPELHQQCVDAKGRTYACGIRSAYELQRLVLGRNVTCAETGKDRYSRSVSTCKVGRREINATMVTRGWAIDYVRYSKGRYAKEQDLAKMEKRGIWGGTFEEPEQWRREH